MNKWIICLLFSITFLSASSQKVYFVYIQSEADQPFFVKMNEKINSSTVSGYLILSRLHDSIYNFNIGFPQNKWAEQNFSIAVNKKDHGYILKNFGDKGWGLFDLQTLAVQMAITGNAKSDVIVKPENKNVSAFTDILSKAADDPSLKEKPLQPIVTEKKPEVVLQPADKKEESKPDVKEPVETKPVEAIEKPAIKNEELKAEVKEAIVKPVQIIEQPVVKKEETKVESKENIQIKPSEVAVQTIPIKEEPKVIVKESTELKPTLVTEQPSLKEEIKSVIDEEYKKSQVTKKSESSTTEGFGLVFLDDHQNGNQDTIRIIIPNPKPTVTVIKSETTEEKKFLDIVSDSPKTSDKQSQKIVLEPLNNEQAKSVKPTRNNCAGIADETDFFKLRKKMASIEGDDDMVAVARNYFKIKCFTVAQLKNLAALFLNDAGKYKFFDVAYAYVTDIENFNSLQNELKDEYYINRFKAILR